MLHLIYLGDTLRMGYTLCMGMHAMHGNNLPCVDTLWGTHAIHGDKLCMRDILRGHACYIQGQATMGGQATTGVHAIHGGHTDIGEMH
jgi:hypothetical protein